MIEIAGIKFKNPIVIASSPLTSHIDLLKKAEDNGAAGASIKLTFSHMPFSGKLRSVSIPKQGLLFGIDRRLNRDEGLELMRKGKEQTSLVLMANISNPSTDLDKWVSLAKDFEQAGADIIEANMTCPHIGLPGEKIGKDVPVELKSGAQIGQIPELCFTITNALKSTVKIPIVPKPYTHHEKFLETAIAIEKAGADAISISSAIMDCLPSPDIYQNGRPSIDLLDKVSIGIITGNPLSKHSAFGKIARVRMNTSLPIIASGGITKWKDIVEMVMWGSSLVGICTYIMWYGFEVIQKLLDGIKRYLENEKIESFGSINGIALKYLTQSNALKIVEGSAKVDSKLCNKCGACLKPGHCLAIEMKNDEIKIDPKLCIGCSICVNLCPQNTIHMERIE